MTLLPQRTFRLTGLARIDALPETVTPDGQDLHLTTSRTVRASLMFDVHGGPVGQDDLLVDTENLLALLGSGSSLTASEFRTKTTDDRVAYTASADLSAQGARTITGLNGRAVGLRFPGGLEVRPCIGFNLHAPETEAAPLDPDALAEMLGDLSICEHLDGHAENIDPAGPARYAVTCTAWVTVDVPHTPVYTRDGEISGFTLEDGSVLKPWVTFEGLGGRFDPDGQDLNSAELNDALGEDGTFELGDSTLNPT